VYYQIYMAERVLSLIVHIADCSEYCFHLLFSIFYISLATEWCRWEV
jgi:hypothetical protein